MLLWKQLPPGWADVIRYGRVLRHRPVRLHPGVLLPGLDPKRLRALTGTETNSRRLEHVLTSVWRLDKKKIKNKTGCLLFMSRLQASGVKREASSVGYNTGARTVASGARVNEKSRGTREQPLH